MKAQMKSSLIWVITKGTPSAPELSLVLTDERQLDDMGDLEKDSFIGMILSVDSNSTSETIIWR